MAYADQQMSGTNRIVAIVIVALIHIALGLRAHVTGLAYERGREYRWNA